MKKIAIVSCYFQKNYGSMLQALATQMAIDKLGYANETIDISGFRKEIKKEKIKYFIKASLTSDILLSKYGMAKTTLIRKMLKNEYSRNSKIRAEKFEQFEKKYIRLSKKRFSKEQLSIDAMEDYSTVVVGSDQLWLPGNIAADYYTLNWVPAKVNTVAYATSFGQSMLPKDITRKASAFLSKIKHISVREDSGQKLVKELSHRNVPVVCDPTLLFSGQDWMLIQKEEPIVDEPYIFVYFLGNNKPHREFVKNLKKETGCKIVALLHLDEYVKDDEKYVDYAPYDVDPSDFLNLIRNASYVCTDSFHCSVFSMQYKKEFYAFRRYSRKTVSSTNSRLDTLFKIAGITNRILNGDEDIRTLLNTQIDYLVVDSNLDRMRKESYDYLKAALSNERNTDL